MLRPGPTHVLRFFSASSPSSPTLDALRFLCSPRTNLAHTGQEETSEPLQRRLLSLLETHLFSRRVAQQIHCRAATTGSLSSLRISNALLRCYSLAGSPREAFLLCKHLQSRDGFSGAPFDSFTFNFLLNACATLGSNVAGAQLHSLSTKLGFEPHLYVQTALVNMYGSCGSLVEAQKVFDEMPQRNSVSWNVLITSFAKSGQPDSAHSLLESMPARNIVSWNAVISGFAQMNRANEAFVLFHTMAADDTIVPSEITLLAIIPAVSSLGDLRICQFIHCYGKKRGFNASDVRVSNSLIDSYAKCGCAVSAWKIFADIPMDMKNLISWTAIITAFAVNGFGKEAVENFERMEMCSIRPNRVTFLGILNACSHGGLVDEGLRFYKRMVEDNRIEPDIKHYGSLIDLLGRAGRLEEAEKVSNDVPGEIANDVIWRTLLGACYFHGDVERAERVTEKILEIERRHGGDYVLMSNVFTGAGRFEDAERLRELMDWRCDSKVLGRSLI